MITVKNLTKIYDYKSKNPKVAINDISFNLPDKGLIFITGKSGSGKSTLLNILGGLDKYTNGNIVIDNMDFNNLTQTLFDSYRNQYIGFIFQEFNLIEDYSVKKNLSIALEIQNEKVSEEKIHKVLKMVDLEGYDDNKVSKLSGGQKQRVALARALIKNPKIILADEPTGNLDFETGKGIIEILKKQSEEKLVIIVSHDRNLINLYGDKIIELDDGKIIKNNVNIVSDYNISKTSINKNEVKFKRKHYPIFKTSKISFNNLWKNKYKFIISIILLSFSMSIFGVALGTRNYNLYDATLKLYEKNNVDSIYFKANQRDISSEEANKIKKDLDCFKLDILYKSNYKILNIDYDFFINKKSLYYQYNSCNYVFLNEEDLNKYGFNLICGSLPENTFEVALPKYLCEIFIKYNNVYTDLKTYEDIIGKEFMFNLNNFSMAFSFKITGIIDTKIEAMFDYLKDTDPDNPDIINNPDILNDFNLLNQLLIGSIHDSIIISEKFLNNNILSTNTYAKYYISWKNENRYSFCYTEEYLNEIRDMNLKYDLKAGEIVLPISDVEDIILDQYHFNFLNEETVINCINQGLYVDIVLENTNNSISEYGNTKRFKIKDYINNDELKYYEGNLPGELDDEIPKYVLTIISSEDLVKFNDYNVSGIITKLSSDNNENKELLHYIYDAKVENGNLKYLMNNIYYLDLKETNAKSERMMKIGLYASMIFGMFAIIMMLNFIINNITGNKKKIGILRALGARGIDVFNIYFIETLIIALISCIISIISASLISQVNFSLDYIYIEYVPISYITIKEIFLMLLSSVFISILGCFAPILKYSLKKPIDVIRQD